MKPSIAIIGAGMAGLTLARELAPHAELTLFEKARGLGGRMSTRRNGTHQWDHGAQFFTARTAAFKALLSPFIDRGIVAEWQPNITTLSPAKPPFKRLWFEPHYVAVPAMNQLLKTLADGLDVRLQTRVGRVAQQQEKWQLHDEHDRPLGEYDWVISSAPLPQTRALLPAPQLGHNALDGFAMQPCYALLLAVDDAALPVWDAARVNNSPINWIAFNHRLPGRQRQVGAVVVHSTPEWAAIHLENDQEQVKQRLIDHFCTLTGVDAGAITQAQLHRWRYAISTEVAEPDPGFVMNEHGRLAACGDWCLGGRVEAAFTSAHRLAGALRTRL
ncbi:NAD(P)/FAD-dependent oxidoreductase [Oceanisphaera psychrotolerans]|uniref:Flavin containing amine oxidoreductase-like protein n=1 Tax=Oceanisphaera psychrotolerans TaxID=1414654 RepID=A0A1J4QD72_9GAMM|nr:FAD-dependent oxidoreductase [Oceanisphaera psychrotolerans]OIN08952.1 flavin containing amine oxidoreductase-like protein [Oceanisphaera psychrotolerans]